MSNERRPPVQLSLLPEARSDSENAQNRAPKTAVLRDELNSLPDVRDGLTREQRVILYTLYEAEKEMRGKRVPTLMLYGRVCERMPMSKDRFQALLSGLVGRGVPPL